MIRTRRDPVSLGLTNIEWWTKWQMTAYTATVNLIERWENGEKLVFREDIWYDLRDKVLLPLFHGKCAYCEGVLGKMRSSSGQVEHYRPKAIVYQLSDSKRGTVNTTLPDGDLIRHPGYFWLAYDWQNLVPSCRDCNAGQRGKGNFFPTANNHILHVKKDAKQGSASLISKKYSGYVYPTSAELNAMEEPLFLHPYFVDPERHLLFDDCGEIRANNSPRAEQTIYHLNLDADGLTTARFEAQRIAESTYLTAYQYHRAQRLSAVEATRLARQAIVPLLQESAAYSAAARAQVRRAIQAMGESLA
jgi:hypothetical protein